jgi:hypothetical protein
MSDLQKFFICSGAYSRQHFLKQQTVKRYRRCLIYIFFTIGVADYHAASGSADDEQIFAGFPIAALHPVETSISFNGEVLLNNIHQICLTYKFKYE